MESNWRLNIALLGLTGFPTDLYYPDKRDLLCARLLALPTRAITNAIGAPGHCLTIPLSPVDGLPGFPLTTLDQYPTFGLRFPYGYAVEDDYP